MKKTVFGVFESRSMADDALMRLEKRGYDSRSVSVIMKESGEVVQKGGSRGDHVVKGATSGATTGAAATTASGAVTGAVAGGLVGGFMGLGLPEENAKIYERRIKAGAILLAVPVVQDQDDEVTQTLKDAGADDVRVTKA